MNSGSSDIDLLTYMEPHGHMTAEAWAVLRGIQVSSAARDLSRAVHAGLLERASYIPPRCYWHPYRPLGAQALMMRAPVLCFCVFGEKLWTLHGWDGPAALCSSGDEITAVFLDLGGTPDHVTRKLRDYESIKDLTHFTVLVPTDTKAEKVRRSAQRRALPLPTCVIVIEDLKELLFHETRKHAAAR